MTYNLDKRKQEKFAVDNTENGVLIVLENKIVSQAEFQTINPDDIESINISKNNKEVAKYSSKNYNKLIVITLKKKQNKREDK